MPIQINISGLLPKVGFDVDLMQYKLGVLAEMARGEWIRLAQEGLGSTSAEYIAGIQPVEIRGHTAAVHLVGELPNDLENGKLPFDMKPGLLNGPRSKVTKKGTRYNTVPFRHGAPGTTGRNVGDPMPVTGPLPGMSAKGKNISAVYVLAKELSPSVEAPSGKTAWGGRLKYLGGLGKRTMLPVPGGRPGAYTWQNSPYAGMAKVQKFYRKATQNQYVTFRRVSENSDPNSWWHPGLRARLFAAQVEMFINREIAELF